MDAEKYERIKNFAKKNLSLKYHNQHLEDCVQYMALQLFQRGEKTSNWLLIFLRFCQNVGLSKYSTDNKRAIQHYTRSIDKANTVSEDGNSEFLLYDRAKEIYNEQQSEKPNEFNQLNNFTYDFMTLFKIKEETKQWATMHYRQKVITKLLG